MCTAVSQLLQTLLHLAIEHDHFLQRLHDVAVVKGHEIIGNALQLGFLPGIGPDHAQALQEDRTRRCRHAMSLDFDKSAGRLPH